MVRTHCVTTAVDGLVADYKETNLAIQSTPCLHSVMPNSADSGRTWQVSDDTSARPALHRLCRKV